jgi:hypothetical protein
MAVYGPTEKSSLLKSMSAIWGSAEQICSERDFRPLTRCGLSRGRGNVRDPVSAYLVISRLRVFERRHNYFEEPPADYDIHS